MPQLKELGDACVQNIRKRARARLLTGQSAAAAGETSPEEQPFHITFGKVNITGALVPSPDRRPEVA